MHSLMLDQLTNSANLLAFANFLLTTAPRDACSLVVIDLQGGLETHPELSTSALRWVALVLREELPGTLYRIGQDEFVAVLPGTDQLQHQRLVQRLAARLDFEAERLGLQANTLVIGLLCYAADDQPPPTTLLAHIHAVSARSRQEGMPPVLQMTAPPAADVDLVPMVQQLIGRIAALSTQLEYSHHLANTDPVTGLPNQQAALERAVSALAQAASQQQPVALLVIDGDNLRRYNQIGYAAGDKLINDLSVTLREQLRPSDYLARWRMGDEFLIILPNTGVSGAASLAERLRRRIETVSQYWPFRVTISLGLAAYPQHGDGVTRLIEQAEAAKQRAKLEGKNRTVIAGVTG
jgi:diguanylate cyclase (GGDEF)-like protein